jgi:O-antigen/teichoic acid export membrane protein
MPRSFTQNISFMLVDKLYGAIVSIAVTPFVIYCLGIDLYGVWVLLNSVSSYFLLAQFGLNAAIYKHVAEYKATKNDAAMCDLVSTGFFLLLGISVAVIMISLPVGMFTLKVMLKNQLAAANYGMFLILVFSICIIIVDQVFASILVGLQKFASIAVISIFSRTVWVAITVVGLLLHYRIEALVLANILLSATTFVLHCVVSMRLLPEVVLSPRRFSPRLAKSLLGFGAKLQLAIVFTWVAQNFDKILIGKFFGAAAVGFYDIGSRLVMFIREVPIVAFTVLLPKMSTLHALDKRDEMRKLYINGSKVTIAIATAAIAVLIPSATALITLWLHTHANPFSVYVFQILAFGTMAALVTGVGSTVCQGIGKPHFEAISNSFALLSNIVLSCLLIALFGLRGVAWGTCLAYLVHLVIFTYLINRQCGISNRSFAAENLPLPLALTSICLGTGMWIHWGIAHTLSSHLYLGAIVAIIIQSLFVLVFMLPIYLYSRFVPREALLALLQKRRQAER